MRANEVAIKRGRVFADPGDPIHILYDAELQKDGTLQLIPVGKEDTDEIIHSYYESTTLESILTRFSNGDTSALNRYQPIYADLTAAPKTLAEALQTVINSRSAFEALPVEVKQKFDSDFNKWLAGAGTEKWFDFMKPVLDPAVPEVQQAAEKQQEGDVSSD